MTKKIIPFYEPIEAVMRDCRVPEVGFARAIGRLTILLLDYDEVANEIREAIVEAQCQNLQIEFMIIGALPYLTLEEHHRHECIHGIMFSGIPIKMDPSRDHGAPVLIYERTSTHAVLYKRLSG